MTFVPIRAHSWFKYLPVLIVLAAACFKLSSPDVPLGLAWGRAIIEHGGLPATNVFSHVNPDRVVLLDKWLFQVLIYGVHQLAGPAGLVLLRVAILGIALWAAMKVARIQWARLPHALLAVGFAIALLNRCYVRAELITWMSIPLTLCLMPLVQRGDKRGWGLLILLQAVWTNSHGYWIVGPLLWLAAGTGAAIQPLLHRMHLSDERTCDQKHIVRLFIAAAIAVAAACITPYGIKTIAHPIRLAIELRSDDILSQAVDDFGSPLEGIRRGGTIPMWACFAIGMAGIFGALTLMKRRRLDGRNLGILALGLVLGLPIYRNMTIMAVCALPLAAAALTPGREERKGGGWLYAVAVLPALLWFGSTFTTYGPSTDYGARRPGFGWLLRRYPIRATQWIARNASDAKLWNDFTEGGWLNWRLGEGHTYIDGNTDGYPLDFLRHYHRTWRRNHSAPWITESTPQTVALVKYGGKDADLTRFLLGISWMESPGFAFADPAYCVVLPSADSPGTDPGLAESLKRRTRQLLDSSDLGKEFALETLIAVPANVPDDLYARSGRLAMWLYPDDPRAQKHFAATQREPLMGTNEHEEE